jgi:hypothetical protein
MSQLEMSQALHKLKRLSAMGPRELAHRFREKGYSELERIGVGTSHMEAPDGMAFKSYLAGAPARRFYLSKGQGLREFVQENFPQWINRAVSEAEKLCRHEVELFSHGPVQLGREIDWHRDPLAGQVWERRFWTDYQPEHDGAGRDSKIIHELNRHQHLPRLAKAYLLTGDERYAAEAVGQLNSWIEQNPPGLGINWQSSLEIGIRAISWLWTIFPLLPSRSLDEASAQRIGTSLFAQLEHINRYTSVFSSPNTHLIGEATALFIGGLVFSDRKRAAVWLETGATLLAEEADKQILDDGVYGELSSYYHCYALDFYLQALTLAQRNQFHFPEGVRQKVCGMLQFLMHLTRPDGTIPLLGDDDGGRALALENRNYRSFTDGLCLGAVLFRREDFKHQAGAFFEEVFWLLGEEAWRIYELLKSTPPAEMRSFFPSAGYAIQRSGWGPLDSHLVFDYGGLGMLAGGHAHADALSVVLFSGGRELLVDSGTFVYNGAPEWRNHFRSTRAHNTVTIDDADQAVTGGTFRWKTRLSCRAAREPAASPTIKYIEAEHDGYLRIPEGVVHRRRVLHILGEYWVIVDDFRGSGKHTFDFNYHFAPGIEVSSLKHDEDELIARAEHAGLLLGLYASQPLRTELIRGQTAPIGGWASGGYGEKKPSLTLRARLAGPVPAAAITLLAPFQEAFGDRSLNPVVRRVSVADGKGIACAYEHDGFEDIVIFSAGNGEIQAAGFRMEGEFFWLRTEAGILKQVAAIRACSFSHDGRNVFQRSEPGPYFNQSWQFEPATPGIDFGAGVARVEEKSICAQSVAS